MTHKNDEKILRALRFKEQRSSTWGKSVTFCPGEMVASLLRVTYTVVSSDHEQAASEALMNLNS